MKLALKHWGRGTYGIGNTIERVYFHIDRDRESIGYIERRVVVAGRSGDTYYDRHRTAKGDTGATKTDEITVRLGEHESAIVSALCPDGQRDFVSLNNHVSKDARLWEAAHYRALSKMSTIEIA